MGRRGRRRCAASPSPAWSTQRRVAQRPRLHLTAVEETETGKARAGESYPQVACEFPGSAPRRACVREEHNPPPVPPLGPGLGRCASDQQKINKRNILKTFFFLIRERERERTSGGSGRQREKQGAQSRTRPQDPGIIPEPKAVT